jgi:multicopper oxidase
LISERTACTRPNKKPSKSIAATKQDVREGSGGRPRDQYQLGGSHIFFSASIPLGIPLACLLVVQKPNVLKDVVMLDRFQEVEFDFVADNPGMTLFRCHQQLHMDFGFMALFKYA